MSREIFGISTGFFGAAVKDLRRELGWSQEALARNLDCSTGAVRQWESGRNRPSVEAVRRMAALAKSDRVRAMFPVDQSAARGYANPDAGEQEFWAHMAVEVIFERAPETARQRTMEFLEGMSGKPWFNGPPSPRAAPTSPAKRGR